MNFTLLKACFSPVMILILMSFSCNSSKETANSNKLEEGSSISERQNDVTVPEGKAIAYFASGCFWCVEAIFDHVQGVQDVISGYSGGHTSNPTYEKSNTGKTGHAEANMVVYDPEIVSFSSLVDVYFGSQNPTQVNGQGPDKGSQYRSIIFYQSPEELTIIEEKKAALSQKLNAPVAAEIKPFEKFWEAEGYHQDYEKLHPRQPYILGVSVPRLNRFKAKFPELLKDDNEIH